MLEINESVCLKDNIVEHVWHNVCFCEWEFVSFWHQTSISMQL